MEQNVVGELFSKASAWCRNSEEKWKEETVGNSHDDFILHTSQQCFGMLPPAIRKAAGFRAKKAYV